MQLSGRLTLTARGARDPASAWERYVRPELWSQWSPQIRRVDCAAGRIAPGVTGVVHGPPPLSAAFTVLQVDDAARRWSWTVAVGPLHLDLAHSVEEVAGGCATTLELHGPWPVVLAYAPLARLALGRLVA